MSLLFQPRDLLKRYQKSLANKNKEKQKTERGSQPISHLHDTTMPPTPGLLEIALASPSPPEIHQSVIFHLSIVMVRFRFLRRWIKLSPRAAAGVKMPGPHVILSFAKAMPVSAIIFAVS